MPASKKEVLPYVGATLQDGRRTSATVEQRFFLTLDADYAHEQFPLDVAVELIGIPYLIHTTWRHSPLAHRYRLIVPLSRGVDSREYKELAWTLMNRLDGKRFDPTTAQAERFMWGPSSRNTDEYFWASANARTPYLPVDEWLDGQHGPSDAPAAGGQGNPPPTPRATRSEAHTPPPATAEDRERALEILAQACDEVEHVYERDEFEGRNEAVFHLLPLLLRFCDAGALDEHTVKDALWTTASRVPADERYRQAEFNASLRKAREYADEAGPVLPETTPTRLAQADFANVDPEIDLWSMTPRMKHVFQAGASQGRNPRALLICLLARILAEAPAGIYLPGIEDGGIGKAAALNLGVALVGSSGQGKTMIIENSMKLLGRVQTDHTPSTGQGLLQAYLKWDDTTGENRLKNDPRAIFTEDEIEKLGALGTDTGSTLFGEIRTMLTGGSTGSMNATRDRQRTLPAGSYNFQFIVGVQPSKAGVLLDGHDAGTPQRFVWVQVTDPASALRPEDRPPWPGPLGWDDAFFETLRTIDPVVRYPDWIKRELEEHDYKVSLEKSEGGELSRFGHYNLLRLKVSAAVAFLHESDVIEDLHVEIADMLLASSKQTQLECERFVFQTAFDRKKAARKSDERVNEELGKEKLAKLVKNARGHLVAAKGEWVNWQTMRPAARDRPEYEQSVWDAVKEMDDVEFKEEPFGSKVSKHARIIDDTP